MNHTKTRSSVFCAFVMMVMACSTVIAGSRAPELQSLGEFAGFVRALHHAKMAHETGQPDVEQQHLKIAEKVLDTMKLEPSTALVRQDFKGIIVQDAFSKVHGQKSPRLQQLYGGLLGCAKGGLYEHLADAIRSHELRMPYYAAKTGGKSTPILTKIATLQRLNLPTSWYIDVLARRFQKAGVPIITADLISMSTLAPQEQAPAFSGIMPEKVFPELRVRLREYQKVAISALKKADFAAVAKATYDIVTHARELEKKHGAHLAMTVHMLDSIGYSALHAADYQKQTSGDSDSLCRQFLAIQIFPLQECLPTDQKAQHLHAMGAGVIVNDVPDIPFLKEWNSRAATRRLPH